MIAATSTSLSTPTLPVRPYRPRVGFVGVGWIGLNRMQAIVDADVVDIAVIADPSPEARQRAMAVAPGAELVDQWERLLSPPLDGVIIATPSAMHAEQATALLQRGMAIFCQKPLARTEAETRHVVEAARVTNRLLAVDLSYRYIRGVDVMRQLIQNGELGQVFAADLIFHNAYGPDKPWFYDVRQSGGGCLIDLGTHLVDLALWLLDFPAVPAVHSRLYREGTPLTPGHSSVEDYADVTFTTENDTTVHLACSWRLSAGCDAVIEARFYGTRGAVVLRNVQGSFYDFTVEHLQSTQRAVLTEPPDAWSGRCAAHWAHRLADNARFDPDVERLIDVARVIDGGYGR